jgi:hypothetical protein
MNKNKILLLLSIFVIGLIVYLYYFFNNSYSLSFSARAHLEAGEYQQALEEATQSYELDHYNRMAFTVMNQANESLKWVTFIKQSRGYLKKIETMSYNKGLSNSEVARIKIMCDITLENHEKLKSAKMLQIETLEIEAEALIEQFQLIYKHLF